MSPTVNKVIGAIGVGASATAAGLTFGLAPAILTGVAAAALWFVGLFHPVPTIPTAPKGTLGGGG
jgi:hypothetical protein